MANNTSEKKVKRLEEMIDDLEAFATHIMEEDDNFKDTWNEENAGYNITDVRLKLFEVLEQDKLCTMTKNIGRLKGSLWALNTFIINEIKTTVKDNESLKDIISGCR